MTDITHAERVRLNELVARAVGFKARNWYSQGYRMETPDGQGVGNLCAREQMCYRICAPDFTRDMDAWLKWGLPWLGGTLRARDRGDRWRIQASPWEDIVVVDAEHISSGMAREEGPLADLPLLLCKLVEKIGEA